MNVLKFNFSLFVLIIVFALIYGCSRFEEGSYYKDGYYITTINQSFDKVYNESLILTNDTIRDFNGQKFDIKINKKLANNKREIVAESESDSSDFIEIVIQEQSKDQTIIAVKHGKNGDTIGSSAFVSMIQENISKS